MENKEFLSGFLIGFGTAGIISGSILIYVGYQIINQNE